MTESPETPEVPKAPEAAEALGAADVLEATDAFEAEQPTQPVQRLQAPQPQATQPQATQPVYAPHPSHTQAAPAFSQPAAPVAPAPVTPATAAPRAGAQNQKSRAGALVAGIAIGALVGGVVGGGAASLIAANQPTPTIVQTQAGGQLTLNNLDSATTVSGVAAVATQSVVTLEVTGRSASGSGSGVIYNEEGYIVTNAHVVTLDGEAGSSPDIRVWLADGRILDGTIVGTDPFADLAVVKVEAEGLVPIAIADAGQINVGDTTIAIGAPLSLSNTVTSGVVSALHRGISVGSPIIPDEQDEQLDDFDEDEDFPWFRYGDPNEQQNREQQQQSAATATRVTLPVIQTDASINPGNSGGALLNANAELIGINVAIASNSDATTAGSDGLGFAIPVNLVTRVAESLIAGEKPSHGLLGIAVNDSSADADEDRNVAGGLIADVTRGGAADLGGLKVGDVITSIDGIPSDSGTTVSALIRMYEGGSVVTITYSRGGVLGETEVTLGTLEW